EVPPQVPPEYLDLRDSYCGHITMLMKEALGLFGKPPPHTPECYSKSTGNKAHHLVSIFNCKQPQSLLKMQEQPVTLRGRAPVTPSDPGAASHPQRKRTQQQPVTLRGRGSRSSQSPSEEEDPGAASHPWRKRTKEQPVTLRGRGSRSTQTPLEQETSPAPIQGRNGNTSMQKYIQQHKKQNITRI
ncbi:hypothetical protein STEG23_013886, partial [Scotinomys teguina]